MKKIMTFAIVLTLIVIMLGAYTRLKDAGLGCPDWPGCYGALTVQPGTIEPEKAWIEMIHRYVAGMLGLLIFFIAFKIRSIMAFIVAGLVIFQALLGMWTVTLKLLPIVVMGHLLGGMAILGLLTWLRASIFTSHAPPFEKKGLRIFALIGLVILMIQIALGGWVSSNYAALICPDVLSCQGKLMPALDFKQAFQLFSQIGPNYQGGVLENTARVTIQFMHRVGAIITVLYLLILSIRVFPRYKKLAIGIIFTLGVQMTLGILNIVWMLPLSTAVLHNGVAALLLMLIVTLNERLSRTL
ncbi:MAG: COX15/CtaA family protein [Gammaproteobacteria bacterium]